MNIPPSVPSRLWPVWSVLVLVTVALVVAGCASAGRSGARSAAAGEWDTAVEYYQRALQDNPDRAEYRIALERAMVNASRGHIDAGRAYIAQARTYKKRSAKGTSKAATIQNPAD